MKAVIENNRTGSIDVAEVPEPALRPAGILVRNEVSLVSAGTERLMVELANKNLLGKARERPDLVRQVIEKAHRDGISATASTVRTRLDTPVPLGYSSAGVIVGVGTGVEDFKIGERVACAGAGYASHAEVVFVPRNLAVRLPESIDSEAAAFATVGAVALHGLRLGRIELGETVVVIGLGLVGLLAVQLAAAAGCRVIGFDPQAGRAKLAEATGAEFAASDPQSLRAAVAHLSEGLGADGVLVAASTKSSDPVMLAAEVARDRGAVVLTGLVGMQVPRQLFYEKELSLHVSRSYGPGRYDPLYEEKGFDYPVGFVRWTENRNMSAFVQQVAAGRVQTTSLVTHRFPIQEAQRAYELLLGGEGEPSLGVLITYGTPTAQERKLIVGYLEGTGESCGDQSTKASVGTPGPRRAIPIPGGIGIGFLGAGAFAVQTLLPVVTRADDLRPVAVCTATGVSGDHARAKFGFAYATTDEARVLSDSEVALIAVATRHHLHASQVIAALESGKHVFVEKPLCLTPDDLRAIVQAYRQSQAAPEPPLLMVGYNRRFAPFLRRLRSFMTPSGEPLVAAYRVNAGYIPARHWVQDPEQGGGRLIGEVCHFVDSLIYLTGSMPAHVFARGLPNRGRYRDDNLSISVEFKSGSVGTIVYVANGSSSYPKERIEVFGGGRTGVLDNFRQLELADRHRRVLRSPLRQDKGHKAELASLVDALRNGGPSPIPFPQLVAASATTFCALESLRLGHPVEIAPVPGDA